MTPWDANDIAYGEFAETEVLGQQVGSDEFTSEEFGTDDYGYDGETEHLAVTGSDLAWKLSLALSLLGLGLGLTWLKLVLADRARSAGAYRW